MNHLAVIGAGNVGTAIAFTALNRGIARHLSLYDVDRPRAIGEMLDLRDGLQFVRPATIEAGDQISVCADADVVVVTAGAKQRPGESRLDLAARNAGLLRSLLPDITRVAPEAVLLIVTNPVDVLTQLAVDMTGRVDGTVFGSGTVLDSSRLRHLIALRFGIAERHVHAHVVGEHGDSETVLWSSANIGGAPLTAAWTRGGGRSTEPSRPDFSTRCVTPLTRSLPAKAPPVGPSPWRRPRFSMLSDRRLSPRCCLSPGRSTPTSDSGTSASRSPVSSTPMAPVRSCHSSLRRSNCQQSAPLSQRSGRPSSRSK